MGITAFPGNLVVFGQAPQLDYNTDDAPSLFQYGIGLLDPRPFYTYTPGGDVTNKVYGWLGTTSIPVVDYVPTTISTNTVAQTQVPVSGTALTLTASNTANVTISQTIVSPNTGLSVTGLRAIDGAMGSTTMGSDGQINFWNPATALSRTITINTSASNKDDSAGSYTIAGRDIYGYLVTETITGSSVGAQLTSQKTYKYISAITPSGTINSTQIIVGVGDTFGLPLFASNGAYVTAYMGNALVLSSTNTVGGSTATATSTTADVRGTFTSSLASNGSRRLVMFITPSLSATSDSNGVQAFGISQYSSV